MMWSYATVAPPCEEICHECWGRIDDRASWHMAGIAMHRTTTKGG